MRLIAVVLLGLAAIAASASTSRAEDGCGRGWYWNGRGCVPMYYAPRPRYEPPYYEPWRYHHRDYDEGPRYYEGYHRPNYHRWHTWNGCPPHYTLQDGLCKPYRGH
jgi:hypothetical protein